MKKALVILLAVFILIISYSVVVIPQETEGDVKQEEQAAEVQEQETTTSQPSSAETIKVEKHWSRYVYPEEVPANVKVHIIERGDTLWDLAGKYLKNHFLWPQIWEANKYIRDAHWIYPEISEEKLAEAEELEELGEEELAGVIEEEASEEAMPHEYKFYEAKKRPYIVPSDVKCSSETAPPFFQLRRWNIR